jgi:uncharacterized membrane protein (UPF0136 family)
VKAQVILIVLYGLLLLIGGLMGYLKAASTVSLVMGVVSALLAFIFAGALWKGFAWGRWGALALAVALIGVFTYRYLGSYKFFPPGFMALVSLVVAVLLFWGKEICRACFRR